jgi:hypothetical protein
MIGHLEAEPDKDEEVRTQVHALLRDSSMRNKWIGVLDDLPSPFDAGSQEVV